jgi:pimeloyl-ACP methyl ester carboxylesterase
VLENVRRRRIALPETGVEIALLDWGGAGPLALLHHANGFCAGVWGPVAEGLRRHFRVVAMDARGHGDSSVPEGGDFYRWELFGRDLVGVAKVIAAEHPGGRVALGLGHSFGGTAFLMASAAEPSLIDRIALLDPVIRLPPAAVGAAARAGRNHALAAGARRRRHVWPSREAARASWSRKALFANWDPRTLDLYAAEGLRDRPDGRVELKCSGEVEGTIFESGLDFDSLAVARRVTVPALIVHALRGDFPRRIHADLADALSDARLREADAGHLIPMQRPDLVVDEVTAFAGIARGSD